MNRLATRLLLAMLAVALLSLGVVPVAQNIAARRTFEDLNPAFRGRVERSFGRGPSAFGPGSERPPFVAEGRFRDAPPGDAPGETPGDAPRDFLLEENTRLFALLSDYRAAQRWAVALGVGGAVLLSAALALLLSRTIAKPIEAVSSATSRLARGDLETRVTLSGGAPSLEVRQLAADFNTMAATLGQLEGERKAMIADIAHELRNPLATLQLRIDALSDGLVAFSEEEAKLLQGQVGLLARLIGDLRTLSLADADKLSLNRLELDLNDLAGAVLRQAHANKGVELEFIPADEPALVNADADRLTQVLNNLLHNGFRVTPKGGEVAVQLSVKAAEVTLLVRDTSPGIAADELGTVFERFVQGRRRDTASENGSGLGLAIVQSLVGLHGGRVKASNYNAGAQLEVVLPRIAENS